MIVASLLLLGQTALTPAAVVDGMVALHGYGAIATSAVEMKPVTVPDLGNAVDVDVRLKNRWRVARDKAMPGVFRPEVAPYHEVFDEAGGGVPMRMTYRNGRTETSTPAPKIEPLPLVEAKDLSKVGGVRVSIERLGELLGVEKKAIPWVYLRRTATVRIDPARRPEPLSLLAAITGAKLAKDGKSLEFDATAFRSLAVATLRAEAKRGPRQAGGEGLFARYEEERPLKLSMGADAHAAATDKELEWIYLEPNRAGQVKGFRFTPEIYREVERKLNAQLESLRRPGNEEVLQHFTGLYPETIRPYVTLSSPSGVVTLGVYARDGKTVISLG